MITTIIIPFQSLTLRVIIDQVAQKQTDSVGRVDFHPLNSFSSLHIQVNPPGSRREWEGKLGSAESGVEPGSPIFNVLTPVLLRALACLLMSGKGPTYPSPYTDSILTAVSLKSSLLSVNNAFLESTKKGRKKSHGTI